MRTKNKVAGEIAPNFRSSITLDEAMRFIFFRARTAAGRCNHEFAEACKEQSMAVAWLFSKNGEEPPRFSNSLDALQYLGMPYLREDEMAFFGPDAKRHLAMYRRIKKKKGKHAAELAIEAACRGRWEK